MRVKFYGVRGSIASPGDDTAGYGGNTACVLLELNDQSLIVFDAGTGIRKLGDELAARPEFQGETCPDIHLLFSHYHWDHIQGFPFFKPAYRKRQTLFLIAAHLKEKDAGSVLGQMIDPHFPIPREKLNADVQVLTLNDAGELHIGEATVHTLPLNHPGGGAAYRIDTANGSMAYVTDNELVPPERPRTSWNEWVQFLNGVDLLIHDAMYLESEREAHLGWGHSIIDQTLQLASDAKVKNLVLFHHDPERSDRQLDAILEDSQAWMKQRQPECAVYMAREGDVFQIESGLVEQLTQHSE